MQNRGPRDDTIVASPAGCISMGRCGFDAIAAVPGAARASSAAVAAAIVAATSATAAAVDYPNTSHAGSSRRPSFGRRALILFKGPGTPY